MARLKSHISTDSDEFRANEAHNRELCETLRERLAEVREGGGGRARTRHAEQGKLFVRERIERLADPGSPFLETGPLAAHDCYDAPTPAAGLVTGVASVSGRLVMVVANDATVKGGTYYPLTVKKHLRAQEIAARCELPCVYLVDSGGAFLPLQAEVFPDRDHFGRIFRNQAVMSARGIPQLAAVMGMCTAGGAYVPAMSDEAVIVEGTGTIYLGGPPLVKAATGEEVSPEELGGARVHTERSGVADHLAEDDAAAIRILREAVGRLPAGNRSPIRDADPEPPDYPEDEILGIWPRDRRVRVDIRETLARLLDGSRLDEFKARYGTTLVTGFGRIEGITVGIVASNGVLFSESGLKGAHFVQLCAREGLPLLFVQDITGFMVGARYEQGGIAKDGAKMVNAVATAEVPKITLIAGGSFGAGNYAMCGRAYDPAFVWSWPASRISVMGGEQAASVLVQVKRDQRERAGEELSGAEAEEIAAPVREKYEREGSPYYATARLWDDGIVDMRNTRRTLALSLAAAANVPVRSSGHGIFRM
ncbi:MAG: methylcrotonoyl-CoA carboxylase [Acidobacteria bacterium]|nr:methylcrotonoyl-CoA carboxylase [Acidobacteriota bacterium]MYF14311.1 methylcrotonoyl-CoA carboxylase [Acidobacteriota bacterium]